MNKWFFLPAILLALFILGGCAGPAEEKSAEQTGAELLSSEKIALIEEDRWSQKLLILSVSGDVEREVDLGDLKTEKVWRAPEAGKLLAKVGFNRWYFIDGAGRKAANVPLTSLEEIAYSALSPDTVKLALARSFQPGSPEQTGGLYVIDTASGEMNLLTGANIVPGFDKLLGVRNPSFSPDGEKIAFDDFLSHQVNGESIVGPASSARRNATIYVIDASGANLIKLIDGGEKPVWSPPGDKIAFIRYTPYTMENGEQLIYPDVYVVNADGSNLNKLAEKAENPLFSRNGDKVALSEAGPINRRYESKPARLYVADINGSDKALIADGAVAVSWSPAGNELIYQVISKYLNKSLYSYYVANVNTSYKQKLGDSFKDMPPVWSPPGDKILFVGKDLEDEEKIAVFVTNNEGKERQSFENLDLTEVMGLGWVK